MLHPVFIELLMRESYTARLREAEGNRLVRQAQVGHRRRIRLLSSLWAWLECRPAASQAECLAHPQSKASEAATASRTGGSLIL
jgi:hypothetical protein